MNAWRGLVIFWFVGLGALLFTGCKSVDLPSPSAHRSFVLFLSPTNGDSRLWRIAPDGTVRLALTPLNQIVSGYAANPDGSGAAYTVRNSSGGQDIWEVDRDGKKNSLIVDCKAVVCRDPSWSPDGKKLAYSRVDLAENPQGRIFIFDASSKRSQSLYTSVDVAGIEPVYSPDGSYLAFYDNKSAGIRLVELTTGNDQLLQTGNAFQPAWSADSQTLYFTNLEYVGTQPYNVVFQYVLNGQILQPWLSDKNEGLNFGIPQFSADGKWGAIGVGLIGEGKNSQIWWMNADGGGWTEISNDPSVSYAGFSWSPDSTRLVFQRMQLKSSKSTPSVEIWDRSNGAITILAEDAYHPAWLP